MDYTQESVTVLVVAYNSSKYIIETLNSIKSQSWGNLSLIISDDGSIDDTVLKCKCWINNNSHRFIDSIIVENSVNTGISANINRGECLCKTTWLKLLGGDDILLPDCIKNNMDYVNRNPEIVLLFSRMLVFGGTKNARSSIENKIDYNFFKLSQTEQYEALLFQQPMLIAPTQFYNIDRFRELNLKCDERIPMWDDYPRWLRLSKLGFRLSFMDKETVLYRLCESSVSSSKKFSSAFFRSQKLVWYYYLMPEYIKKYGEDFTINKDINNQLFYFNEYVKYRYLLTSRLYSFIKMIFKKLQEILHSL